MILADAISTNGLNPGTRDAVVKARGAAFELGDVVQFDLALSDADVINNVPGNPSSGFFSVITPTSGGVQCAVLGVCLEAIADDAVGLARVIGIVPQAYVIKASGSIAAGDRLVATTGHDLDGVHAAGERYVAIALEAATTPTSHTLKRVYFDGLYGLGTFVS